MCGVIRFLHNMNKNPTEIYRELVAAYDKYIMSKKQISFW